MSEEKELNLGNVSKRYFKCWKCGYPVYTEDGSKPNSMCVQPMSYRTSGICGGSYTLNSTEKEFNAY